jgi:hypothetical protein
MTEFTSPYSSNTQRGWHTSEFRRVVNVSVFLLGDSPASEIYVPTFRNTLPHLHRRCEQEQTSSPQCVPKYHHIKFSRRGITQKKEYKTTENTSLPCNVSFCVFLFGLFLVPMPRSAYGLRFSRGGLAG